MNKRFITIEGGEGCGKSTLCTLLSERLNERDIDHIVTREPGGVESSERIRDVIMNHEIDKKTEVLLFAAARNEHLKEKVIPALEDNKVVVCDRYIDSSLAYQGHAQGLGIDAVLGINQYAIENFFPSVTFWLDMEPKDALARITNEREINRFDQKALDFHDKVREGYQILAKRYPERIIKLDGNLPTEELVLQVLDVIC